MKLTSEGDSPGDKKTGSGPVNEERNHENVENITVGGGESLDSDSMKDTEAAELNDLLTEKTKEVGITDDSQLMVLIR